jgi:hypothetical protein
MCGQFRHAAAATRGAESAFATERNHHLVPALLAPHVQAAPREKTASQVRLELLLHERWPSAPSIAGLDLRQKLGEVLLDHPIENRRFGNTPGVRPRRRTRHRHERGAAQDVCPVTRADTVVEPVVTWGDPGVGGPSPPPR